MADGPLEQGRSRFGRVLFMLAIGLSAFLLFTLELTIGRVILPVFGGSPSVWTTALCFFTAALYFGYLYAHLIATRLSRRTGGRVHVALVIVTLGAMFLAPADVAAVQIRGASPVIAVLVALATTAGAPAFLLASTTPLLSSWYADGRRDPWWLYAMSNAASLAGLLAYPFVIEPNVPLSVQRDLIGGGVLLLAGVLATITVVNGGARLEPAPGHVREGAPSRRRRAIWLLAAAVPAGLLSATTLHLSTDHVSTPLLWIGPLGVYLGSFVVAFSERGRLVLPVATRLAPAAATLLWIPYVARTDWPVAVLVPLVLGSYGVLAVAIHGRLALDRPNDAHLTRFYLLVSAGGLVATAFVALVAPIVFPGVYEYPILIVLGLVVLALLPPGAACADRAARGTSALRDGAIRVAPLVLVGAVLVATTASRSTGSASFVAVVLTIGALTLFVGRSFGGLAAGTAIALVVVSIAFAPAHLTRVRTFFGVTEVREAEGGAAHAEIHGTTLHGLQYLDERRGEPTAYFVRSSPLGDVMADLQERKPDGGAIGVVGLGVGTLAAYQRPADTLTFYEIDPAVVDIARDPRYFTYLADAPAEPRIVIGDGRLSLGAEADGSFDLLVLDAFASDTVPAHLLTHEAMVEYMSTLRPEAVMVFQLTNRHFDLVDAVGGTARSLGLDARVRRFQPGDAEVRELSAQASTWVVVGRAADVARFDAFGWSPTGDGPVLTDDYSAVLRLLSAF